MTNRWLLPVLLVALVACGGVDAVGGRGVPGEPGQAASVSPAGSSGQPAEVSYVLDGDTIEVTLDGTEERVRLIGIDAPERGDCYADESRELLRELVAGRDVRLERDVRDRDRYDRLLRYVFVDGRHVNRELVAAGAAMAKEYPPDTARADELAAAEEEARGAGRGLWGSC